MGKIPDSRRAVIAANIRACRMKKFPGRGGSKKCAEAFGVSPQQWSPWERGMRTPDEYRLERIAQFFDVTVEYLRRDNAEPAKPEEELLESGSTPLADAKQAIPVPHCPFYRPPAPGKPMDSDLHCLCWLAERFFTEIRDCGVRLHPDDMRRLLGRG